MTSDPPSNSHSLPSAEEARISAGWRHSEFGEDEPPRRRRWVLPLLVFLSLASVGLIVGLSVGLTERSNRSRQQQQQQAADGGTPPSGPTQRADPNEDDRGSIRLTSSAFGYGDPIPARYAADGDGLSPPLAWSDLPDGTRSLVVLCEDVDFPRPRSPAPYPRVHWIAYDVPPSFSAERVGDDGDGGGGGGGGGRAPRSGLPEGLPNLESVAELEDVDVGTEAELRQGVNDWGAGEFGYHGPDVPDGHPPHRYYFRVLALDGTIGGGFGSPADVTMENLLEAVEGDGAEVKVLGFGLLMGRYRVE